MERARIPGKVAAALTAVAITAALSVTLASADTGPGGPVKACVRTKGTAIGLGSVRVIDGPGLAYQVTPPACNPNETALDWSTTGGGPVGPTGPRGATGLQGPIGPIGPTGAGATGAQGPTGAQGVPGATGATGANGSPGTPGPTGVAGATGAQGATGPAGTPGAKGSTGALGPTGVQGATGSQGPSGGRGPTGAGATGPQGPTGAQGVPGAKGTTGANGPAGSQGSPGPTGPAGVSGFPGSVTVPGTAVSSATNPGIGQQVTATASCPTGSLLGGGGRATVNGPSQFKPVALYESYASGPNTWTVSGVVLGRLGGAARMVVQAYALCTSS